MEETAILRVRLTPKGGRNALDRIESGLLFARVAAPPVDGAANKAVVLLLSESLHVPRSRITLHSGETGREKVFRIAGMTQNELEARLTAALQNR
jgi:uncharacterized protein YggU (UPF0235/DUF167 family)